MELALTSTSKPVRSMSSVANISLKQWRQKMTEKKESTHPLMGKVVAELCDYTLSFGKVIEVRCTISDIHVHYVRPDGTIKWSSTEDLYFMEGETIAEVRALWKICERL